MLRPARYSLLANSKWLLSEDDASQWDVDEGLHQPPWAGPPGRDSPTEGRSLVRELRSPSIELLSEKLDNLNEILENNGF